MGYLVVHLSLTHGRNAPSRYGYPDRLLHAAIGDAPLPQTERNVKPAKGMRWPEGNRGKVPRLSRYGEWSMCIPRLVTVEPCSG
jgi:hypothetical protein